MKLTIEQINKLKEYGFITQIDPSSDILSHSIDTVELGKIWKYINQTDRTEIIEEWLNNGPTPSKNYLTFDILSDGKIYWVTIVETEQSYDPTDYCKTIQYSKDDGETWSSITSSDLTSQEPTYIEVSTGDKILFKGNNSSYALINDSVWSVTLFGMPTDEEGPALDGASFNISGNIMSLIGGDNFEDLTTLTDPYTFSYLFGVTKTIDTSGLILPATTLTQGCYQSMFTSCTSLTTAPSLPATTLAEACYCDMFSNCTSLNYIKCLATDISAAECTYGWVDGVSNTGTFIRSENMNDWPSGRSGIPIGWDVTPRIDYSSQYFHVTTIGDPWDQYTLKLNNSNISTSYPIEFQYKTNNSDWSDTTTIPASDSITITVHGGDTIYFKSTTSYWGWYDGGYLFHGTDVDYILEGNIMSLIYGDNFVGQTVLPEGTDLGYLFAESSSEDLHLIDVSHLILPATSLNENDYCYQGLFSGCALITTAPELPADILVNHCYSSMFSGCTSLNYIKCLATDISVGGQLCTYSWVNGVSNIGTFVKATGVNWPTGDDGIPSGWTVEEV